MKNLLTAAALVATLSPLAAHAGPSYIGGAMSNVSSSAGGLLVMWSSGIPDNCAGTPYNWMIIPESNKTMIAVALTMWSTGRKGGTIYTSQFTGNGYCVINQLDPDD